jgi:hypothetical protein
VTNAAVCWGESAQSRPAVTLLRASRPLSKQDQHVDLQQPLAINGLGQ